MRELSPERLEGCVEQLFRRMAAMYGRLFADMWAGSDLADVKAIWAEDLSPFCWRQIEWAMEQCKATKDFPPTLPMFRGFCLQAPRPEAPKALPAPEIHPNVVAARQAEAEAMARQVLAPKVDHKAWATLHRADWLAGRNVRMIVVEMASDALGERWHTDNGRRECSPAYGAEAA